MSAERGENDDLRDAASSSEQSSSESDDGWGSSSDEEGNFSPAGPLNGAEDFEGPLSPSSFQAPSLRCLHYPALFAVAAHKPVIVADEQLIRLHVGGWPVPTIRIEDSAGKTVCVVENVSVPICEVLLKVSILESGTYRCIATNEVGEASIEIRILVSDSIVVNTCPIGNPVFAMEPSAAAMLVFCAVHQVQTANNLSYAQAIALLNAAEGDLNRFVCFGVSDFFSEIPDDHEPTRMWESFSSRECEDVEGSVVADQTDAGGAPAAAMTQECGMCEEEFDKKEDMQCLNDCHHTFCRDCMRLYLESMIDEVDSYTQSRFACPEPDCGMPLHPGLVLHLLPEARQSKFLELTAKALVYTNNRVVECVEAACPRMLYYNGDPKKAVDLPCDGRECTASVCYKCRKHGHAPAACIFVQKWGELGGEQAAEAHLERMCKKCPKCGNGAYIPDKVACNHMSCACGAQWCWLCFKPWNSHSVCSPVPDRLINRDMSDKEKWMGTALGDELYQFLLDRYMYHDRCAMLVQKHLPRDIATFRSKIENFADASFNVDHETKFLDTVPAELGKMQELLKNSYIFLYFELDGLKKDLFMIAHEKLTRLIGHLQERMSNLLTSELHTLSQDFLPSKLYRWRADIQALIAGISRTAHEFNKSTMTGTLVSDPKLAKAHDALMAQEQQYMQQGNYGWTCSGCTFRNALKSKTCKVCKLKRQPRSGSRLMPSPQPAAATATRRR